MLRVQVSGYSNPGNTCAQCANSCCNSSDMSCQLEERCDNEFFYCLMPFQSTPLTSTVLSSSVLEDPTLRAGQLGCLPTSVAMRSSINTNGESINFNSATVLGLSNPLEFEVDTVRWEVRKLMLTKGLLALLRMPLGYHSLCGCA